MEKIIIALLLILTSCGELQDELESAFDSIGEEVTGPVNDTVDDAIDDAEGTPSENEEAQIVNSTDFFVPDNCDNPPKNISRFDGFKCMASTTRGGSVVCLLPYQFTWPPYKNFTDHHGVTMKCNLNDDRFNKVNLILKDGSKISLSWDKCQNWVGTNEGKIGRQHFRNETVRWDNIRNKVDIIEMKVNGEKTCLKF